VVSKNTALESGGCYNFNDNGGTISLTNCTIFGNDAHKGGAFNWNVDFNNSSGISVTTLTNCIFCRDSGGEIANANDALVTSKAIVTYSNVQDGSPGKGNISSDPLFANVAVGDFHLKSGSPCLGTGTRIGAPIADRDSHPRPIPPSMGAYEMTSAR